LGFWETFLVALALAMDALAVSVGLGICAKGALGGCALRAAAAFGLFQAGMTLGGWGAGLVVTGWVEAVDHWVAAGILVAIGARMLVEALRRKTAPSGSSACDEAGAGDRPGDRDASRGWLLIALAVATSLDALGAGMGLAMVGTGVWIAAAVIGVVAAVLSAAGVALAGLLARSAGAAVARAAEVLGAVVLLGIAVRIALCG
jgi:putative Mn2+ efflux pump MntP